METLADHIKFDHGYTAKSPAILNVSCVHVLCIKESTCVFVFFYILLVSCNLFSCLRSWVSSRPSSSAPFASSLLVHPGFLLVVWQCWIQSSPLWERYFENSLGCLTSLIYTQTCNWSLLILYVKCVEVLTFPCLLQHSSTANNTAANGTGASELADDDLPSVMTCANYLKLPPYSTKVLFAFGILVKQ